MRANMTRQEIIECIRRDMTEICRSLGARSVAYIIDWPEHPPEAELPFALWSDGAGPISTTDGEAIRGTLTQLLRFMGHTQKLLAESIRLSVQESQAQEQARRWAAKHMGQSIEA